MKRVNLCVALLMVLIGCGGSGGADHEAPKDPKRGLELTLSPPTIRNLNGTTASEGWTTTAPEGTWRFHDGTLTGRDVQNQPIWLVEPLPEWGRLELDATCVGEGCDIRLDLFGDGERHETGYVMTLGAFGTDLDILARQDEHASDRAVTIRPGTVVEKRKHHLAIVWTDAELRCFVDGELVAAYDDSAPLRGEGNDRLGLGGWTGEVTYDNVAIFRLSEGVE